MRSVREFKDFVRREADMQIFGGGEFCKLSNGHMVFWQKLNRIGWSKKTKEPDETPDIDATALLTDEEWAKLEAEFRKL